ncbi:hypothetical protein V6N13_029894 [Hibiscus sabdariffa]
MIHKEWFQKLGVHPPKEVLSCGPPGTRKTLTAHAWTVQTNAMFPKLAGPQLVNMFIGDGIKLVRDAFQLAIGTKCFDSEHSNRSPSPSGFY